MAKTQQIIKQESKFLNAEQVAEILGISITSAYRIIRRLNDELKQKGFITVSGRISKTYFESKVAL